MPRCIRCGDITGMAGRRVCQDCMKKWIANRTIAYDAVAAELGPDSAENHEAFVKRLKEVERERKAEPRATEE